MGSTTGTEKPAVGGPATIVGLVGICVVAALLGAAMLAVGVFGIIHATTADVVTLPQPVKAEIPVQPPSGGTALIDGTYRMADVTVSGLETAPRALLAVSHVLSTITYLIVIAGVITLCVGLLRGRPFMPIMRRVLIAVSGALVVGGMLSSALLGFANVGVADALDLPGFPMMANFDFTAPLIGIVLSLVALAFQVGEKLQRDTDGLV